MAYLELARPTMKPVVKYFLFTLGVLALLLLLLYVLGVVTALKSHAKEDKIIFESKRVQEAINDYVEKHGRPPPKLEALVPEFIKSMPSFPEISIIDYHLSSDGKNWTLDLHRNDPKIPLIYRRTDAGLSSEDTKRRIGTENGCYVLKAH